MTVGVGGAGGDATSVDVAAWERDLRTNVTSMMLMSRYAIRQMKKAGGGAIVNMSSVSGREFHLVISFSSRSHLVCPCRLSSRLVLGGNPNLVYPTSKGAVIQMTRAMAAQHGRDNIRVNCVCPGMVYTPMVRGRGMTAAMRQARVQQNLLGREGTAWDVGYGKCRRREDDESALLRCRCRCRCCCCCCCC